MDTKMIYIDDSGRPQSGLVVYGFVEFSLTNWLNVMKAWLDFRKDLWKRYRIPVDKELHTTEFANGRGDLSKNFPDEFRSSDGTPYKKDFGQHIARLCLTQIASIQGVRVGAVFRQSQPEALGQTRTELYRELIKDLNGRLEADNMQALIYMDGEDDAYRHVHRELKLQERAIIEDPVMLSSKDSQLIQMADLVAWSAYSTVNRHPSQKFAWSWYQDYLAVRDPRRSPMLL
ncbi:MAG: DUF3800 domain-containing protein [Rothia sp. (in: high G+C Gram-positive bacteria)]|nr:DUF3800 domain-containing protein [Rothia sp. (in: high G+C Gram-positive bacteria)]